MKLLLLLGIPVPVVFTVEEDSSTSCVDMVVDGMTTVGLLVMVLEHDAVCWSSNNASHRKPEQLDHPTLILMRRTFVKIFR